VVISQSSVVNSLLSSEFAENFQKEVPLFFKIPKFPFNTVKDKSREAFMPKMSLIHAAVLIKYWLVTDTHRPIANTTPA